MNKFCVVIGVVFVSLVAIAGFVSLSLVMSGCRWVRNAEDVAFKETSPESLLKKYEWFKDASAKLDAKYASIEVAETRLQVFEKSYAGVARKDWPRHDAEQHSVWTQEIAGLKMSFNQLAAEYNARMAKDNYDFTNQGRLPQGATKPLPREYKPYIVN